MTDRNEPFMDDPFKKIETDTFVQNRCSPQPPDDPNFRGILINAPGEVRFRPGDRIGPFGAFAFIPVCGFYRLGVASMPPHATDFCDAFCLVARQHKTGLEFTGALVEPAQGALASEHPPVPDPSLERKVPPGFAVGGYFNVNAAQFVSLPPFSATYDILVELGDRDSDQFITSNMVTVKIEAVQVLE